MIKPHFIIAGERRSGSSTLYEILKQHPDIGMFEKSDYDYFIEQELFSMNSIENSQVSSWKENHSIAEYNSIFKHLEGKAIGYKDADLLWWKPSHERIAEFNSDSKFIFILRDPVKRAESQYFNELKKGRENLSFEGAKRREENDSLNNWQQLHLQYISRGKYVDSLEHFYKLVPKDQVLVIILEELLDKSDEVMTTICEFLNINFDIGKNLRPQHTNKEEFYVRKSFSNKPILKWVFDLWEQGTEALIVRITKNKDSRRDLRKYLRSFYKESKREKLKLDVSILKELAAYYKPSNLKLDELLGRKNQYWNHD
tara:strand:+ start:1056 stop:1994 length:939 start_codon:yes stop_codon:yes gene_type:complete